MEHDIPQTHLISIKIPSCTSCLGECQPRNGHPAIQLKNGSISAQPGYTQDYCQTCPALLLGSMEGFLCSVKASGAITKATQEVSPSNYRSKVWGTYTSNLLSPSSECPKLSIL